MISAPRAEPYYPAELPLADLRATRAELEQHFGPPHRLSDAEDDEPGPCAYWAYQFPCGLVGFIVSHSNDSAALYADAAEHDHLLRHLELPKHLRQRVRKCESRLPGRPRPTPQVWNLWRQDLHGNRFLVGTHPTLRAADCMRVSLESGEHKQVYWVEQETIGRKDFKLCPHCLAEYQALKHRPDAQFGYSFVPFACIAWGDEHPGHHRLCHGHPDCATSILKLSDARLGLWKTGAVPDDHSGLWDDAQQMIPNWPGFKRLTIGPKERDALDGFEREAATVPEMFKTEGWKVEPHGRGSFRATKTWVGALRQKVGLSKFGSQEVRFLRRMLAFAFLSCLAIALAGAIGLARLAPTRQWPVQFGQVVEVRPGPWFILHRRADVRIQLQDGATVHAIVAPYLTRQLPREVRFHYSGNPSREVFLHELENSPDWFFYAGLPAALFFGWYLFFGKIEKAPQGVGARGPTK